MARKKIRQVWEKKELNSEMKETRKKKKETRKKRKGQHRE